MSRNIDSLYAAVDISKKKKSRKGYPQQGAEVPGATLLGRNVTSEAATVNISNRHSNGQDTYDTVALDNPYYCIQKDANLVDPVVYDSTSPSLTYSQLVSSQVPLVQIQQQGTSKKSVRSGPYYSVVRSASVTPKDRREARKCWSIHNGLLILLVALIIAIVAVVVALVVAFVLIASLHSNLESLESTISPPPNSTAITLTDLDNNFQEFVDETKKKLLSLRKQVNLRLGEAERRVKNVSKILALEAEVVKSIYELDSNLSRSLQEQTMKTSSALHAFMEYTSGSIMNASGSAQNSVNSLATGLVNDLQVFHVFDSCAAIMTLSLPFPSGKYWVKSSNGSTVQMNCTIYSCNGVAGGWRRIAHIDTGDGDPIQCPSGLEVRVEPPSCSRTVAAAGCSSVSYSNHDIPYSCIYGRVNARQSGSLDGFENFSNNRPLTPTLEDNYVDGVSLTHGSNPRNHIWTFVAGESTTPNCNACNTRRPAFIGNDFSCEINVFCEFGDICFDQLWNGGPQQCVGNAAFYRQLSQPTAEDIEMRVCRDEMRNNEDILVTLVEIYVV